MSETAFLLWIAASFASGLILALFLAITNTRSDVFNVTIRCFLYLGTVGAVTTAALSGWRAASQHLVELLALAAIVAGLFTGGLIAGAAACWLATHRESSVSLLLFQPPIIWAARCLTAATFLMVGVNKLLTNSELSFFQASGYSESFYIFICIFECVCAFGLLLRVTVVLSVFALWVEMVGAIYTHFHNYFVRGFADPLGNSLDALRMLLLLTYIGFVMTRREQHATLPARVESI